MPPTFREGRILLSKALSEHGTPSDRATSLPCVIFPFIKGEGDGARVLREGEQGRRAELWAQGCRVLTAPYRCSWSEGMLPAVNSALPDTTGGQNKDSAPQAGKGP